MRCRYCRREMVRQEPKQVEETNQWVLKYRCTCGGTASIRTGGIGVDWKRPIRRKK